MSRFLLLAALWISSAVDGETLRPVHPILVASPDGSHLVKVDDLGPNGARAVIYRQTENDQFAIVDQFSLKDGRMPRDAFISNRGLLLTLDSWYSYGIGENTVVVYGETGHVVKHYSLEDLYSQTDMAHFVRTSSSTHWRCVEISPRIVSGNELHIYDRIHGELLVDMSTGNYRYNPGSALLCPEFP